MHLLAHPAVQEVYYPGLAHHPGHAIAARQMLDFGAMVSFTLRGGEPAALDVAGGTRLFTLAESLGAVESLIEHPAQMTHASVAGSELEVDPASIGETTRFREDLDADSLDLYTLVQELEDSYGVRISDEEAARILTVGQAVEFVVASGITTASEVPGDD